MDQRGLHKNLRHADLLGEELIFGDLRRNDVPKDAPPVYHHKVQVIVSDTTEQRMVVLLRYADKLGWADPDRVPVALAVRMRMRFPAFSNPCVYSSPRKTVSSTLL